MSAVPIEPLMKVTVAWDDSSQSGRGVEFVVGIGPGGLAPFEHLLSGRTAGDEVRFTLASAEEAGRFFGHLAPAFGHVFKAGVACVVRIDAVGRPDPREVVRALAETTGHGPCDCGCGCGGSNERNPFS